MFNFFKIIPDKYRLYFFIIPFLIFFGTLLEILNISILLPLLVGLLEIDSQQELSGFTKNIVSFFSFFTDINYLLICLFFLYLFKSIYLYLQNFLHYLLLAGIRKEITIVLLKKYLNLTYIQFSNKNSNILLRNLTEVISQFTGTYLNSIFYIVVEFFLIFLILCFLILINFKMVILMISASFILTLFYLLIFKNRIRNWGEYRVKAQAEIFSLIKEAFVSFIEIRLYKSEIFFLKNISKIYSKFKFQDTLYQSTLQVPKIFFEFLAIVILILFIFIGFKAQSNLETFIVQLGIFSYASMKLLPSLSRLNSQYSNYIYSKPNVDLLISELNEKQVMLKNTYSNYDFNKSIELNNINYSYSDNKVLDNINLSIMPNKVTAITGESGSGKSTLIKIILGFLSPSSGYLVNNNFDIKENDPNWFSNFSIVTQDVSILDKSLMENITYENRIDKIDIDLYKDCVFKSGIYKSELDLFDIKIKMGDMGARISGGQKQRIQIARALYHKSNVLILDEPTSSLDENLEKEILNEICSFKEKLTIIFITHNSKNLIFADSIFRIVSGKISKIK